MNPNPDANPAISQPSSGGVLNRDNHPQNGPVGYRDRPISEIIAKDNRFLKEKLTGSFKGYVVYTPSSIKNNIS